MRVHVIFAHPSTDSFQAALHRRLVAVLRARGDEVRDFDLHAMGFDPVMADEEWRGLAGPAPVPADLQPYVEALRWAEALVFCYPTWWSGLPAILKGYFDRVWRPGIAFEVPPGGSALKPMLTNIRRVGVVTTCGSPWWYTVLYMGNPGRKVLLRGLKPMCGRAVRHLYMARYAVERITRDERERFARKVEREFSRF